MGSCLRMLLWPSYICHKLSGDSISQYSGRVGHREEWKSQTRPADMLFNSRSVVDMSKESESPLLYASLRTSDEPRRVSLLQPVLYHQRDEPINAGSGSSVAVVVGAECQLDS